MDNVKDCLHKDRNAKGERAGHAILTESDVLRIRQRFSDGELRDRLAREHGVVWRTVDMIVKRQTWKHVHGPHPALEHCGVTER